MTLKPFLPAALCLALITYLSITPNVQLPRLEWFSADKLAHAAAYAVLTASLLWGFRQKAGRSPNRGETFLAFGLAAGYGAFMEWVQGTFFPYRFFEYDDMLANAAGAFLAVMIYRLFQNS